jgi:hypothetical protein
MLKEVFSWIHPFRQVQVTAAMGKGGWAATPGSDNWVLLVLHLCRMQEFWVMETSIQISKEGM